MGDQRGQIAPVDFTGIGWLDNPMPLARRKRPGSSSIYGGACSLGRAPRDVLEPCDRASAADALCLRSGGPEDSTTCA